MFSSEMEKYHQNTKMPSQIPNYYYFNYLNSDEDRLTLKSVEYAVNRHKKLKIEFSLKISLMEF